MTQESNPGLPHYRQMLYLLSHQGSPKVKPNELRASDLSSNLLRNAHSDQIIITATLANSYPHHFHFIDVRTESQRG